MQDVHEFSEKFICCIFLEFPPDKNTIPLQESHKTYLSKIHGFHIPTKKDFDRFDVDPVDGIICFDEWQSVQT